jgi:hypothetical protein
MDYRKLISQGRKAGLQTSELYRALGSSRPDPGERKSGKTDGNGYVTVYSPEGKRSYRPHDGTP